MLSDKKYSLTVWILILGLISISSSTAQIYSDSSPVLCVIAEEVTPEPVEPGQDLTLKIRLINEGAETAEDVSLKLNAQYPFYIKTESNNFYDKKTVCAGCSVDNAYYLTVDANAKSGIYPLDFEIYRDGMVFDNTDAINIKVVGKPDLLLNTDTSNITVSSGESFVVEFEAKNIGTGIARNIKIIPESDTVMMLGSNIDFVNELKTEQKILFKSKFMVKDSLRPDTYKFPVTLNFVDEQGNDYYANFSIGVNIMNRADLGFQSVKATPTNPTLTDELSIEGIIENTGVGDAEKVLVELITSENKTFKSFVGQVKSDDDSPFYFKMKPDSIGIQTSTLKISYYDDFGYHEYLIGIEKEITRPTNNIITGIIVFVILLFMGIYFYYRKRKPSKK